MPNYLKELRKFTEMLRQLNDIQLENARADVLRGIKSHQSEWFGMVGTLWEKADFSFKLMKLQAVADEKKARKLAASRA